MEKKINRKKLLIFMLSLGKIISAVKILIFIFISACLLKMFFIDALFVPSESMEETLIEGDYVFINKFIYGPKTPGFLPFTNIAIPRIIFPGFKEPQIGDVIAFVFPGNKNQIKPRREEIYIKRVCAVSGDTIQILDGHVFVRGIRLNYNFKISEQPKTGVEPDVFLFELGYKKDKFGPLRIPAKGDIIKINYENFSLWKNFIEREGHTAEGKGLEVFIDGKSDSVYLVEKNYCFVMGDNMFKSYDSRFWGFLPYENVIGKVMLIYWSVDFSGVKSFMDVFKSIRSERIGKVVH